MFFKWISVLTRRPLSLCDLLKVSQVLFGDGNTAYFSQCGVMALFTLQALVSSSPYQPKRSSVRFLLRYVDVFCLSVFLVRFCVQNFLDFSEETTKSYCLQAWLLCIALLSNVGNMHKCNVAVSGSHSLLGMPSVCFV